MTASAPISLRPGLISVVIPAAGVDEWLDQAIRSSLHDSSIPLEVVVSLNGKPAPQGWWALEDPRVIVLEHPDRLGPAGATIAGLAAARGEFYAHLDADDLMSPTRLTTQLAYLMTHPETPLVGSGVSWITPAGEPSGQFALPTGDDIRRALVRLNVVPHSAWMLRREALESVGGYDRNLPQMEDYDVLLRLGQLGPIANLPQVLTSYRLHPGQLSRSVLPTGAYVKTILAGRTALGRKLGLSRVPVAAGNAWWLGQQWAMYGARAVRTGIARIRSKAKH